MRKQEKFSKKTMRKYLQHRYDLLVERFGFDHERGSAQLRGQGTPAHIAYGEFEEVLHIADTFEIDLER